MTVCIVCGRTLTRPVSIRRRVGPTCWERLIRTSRTVLDCFQVEEEGHIRPQLRLWVEMPHPGEADRR